MKEGNNEVNISKKKNVDFSGDNKITMTNVINNINKSSTYKKILSVVIGLICIFAGFIYFYLTGGLISMLFGYLLSVGIGSAVVFFNIIE